jgi:hypothetical protein
MKSNHKNQILESSEHAKPTNPTESEMRVPTTQSPPDRQIATSARRRHKITSIPFATASGSTDQARRGQEGTAPEEEKEAAAGGGGAGDGAPRVAARALLVCGGCVWGLGGGRNGARF